MGIKETIIDFLNLLETVDVTNQDNSLVKLYARLFNNQIERKKEGKGYDYQTPACFVELEFSEGLPIGQGVTSYELKLRLLVEHTHYNTEDKLDENLIVFDLKDSIHRKVNNYKPVNCSPLFQSGRTLDIDHDNITLVVMEYSTHFIDLIGSALDEVAGLYIIDTLVNPQIIFNENIITSLYTLFTENNEILITENNQTILYE